ncbi:hypothetical protein JMJ35_001116 [Cladonia borealis]|uniref:G domain-containing protein n=1 Tax=Cladonia borealis TaxID=184061 RepID=A0AA39R7Y9_9LECA|nr:hypothetical protein JMJ35_001116 [Cladonia borealis]
MASPPILVAVMGVTGSGKTSYVAGLTGRADIVPSEDLESATASITAYDACIDGINFSIVDTPGFNDTYQNESQILAKLADWLSSTYRDGRRLSGLIYLHSIAKSRMSGTSRLNLSVFQNLCGQHSYENITLCTTFWGSVDPCVGESRESQLFTRDDFWGNMIRKGAKTERIHDYSDLVSRRVLLRFADKGEIVLTVQKEMVDDKKPLEQTAASQVVNTELDHALESFRIRANDMEQELAQRRMKRHLQNQQNIEHQQSIRNLDERYRREAKEREKRALEAKEEERHRAQERLQRQEEENRRDEEQRVAEKREQAAKEAERRKLELKRREESLRQWTSDHFRKIFARQCSFVGFTTSKNLLLDPTSQHLDYNVRIPAHSFRRTIEQTNEQSYLFFSDDTDLRFLEELREKGSDNQVQPLLKEDTQHISWVCNLKMPSGRDSVNIRCIERDVPPGTYKVCWQFAYLVNRDEWNPQAPAHLSRTF